MQSAKIVRTDTDVVDGSLSHVARALVVEMDAALADAHEDVARSSELTVVRDDAAELLRPPRNRGVGVLREEVDVVNVLAHALGERV